MSENNPEEISVHRVFVEISKYLENEKLFERLQNILHGEQNYKLLLKTGENQFFDAPNESIEDARRNTRFSYATIKYLSQQVENDIDKIVREKFQGEFLKTLKNEVLQAIFQLSSDQHFTVKASPSSAKSNIGRIQNGSGKEKEHSVANQQSDESNMSNGHGESYLVTKVEDGCVENESEMEREYNLTNRQAEDSNLTNGQFRSNRIKLENGGIGNLDLMFTFDDVSSVHTSDLSSFEDEISVSSDEEFGEKRRFSLKEVQEKLESSQFENMESEEDDKPAKNNQSQDSQYSFTVNGNDSSEMLDQKGSWSKKFCFCFNPLKKPNHSREVRGLRRVQPWMCSLFPEATEQDKICGTCRRQISKFRKCGENEILSVPCSSQGAESFLTDSNSVSQKSQRKRKPNLKYTYEKEVMPLNKKSTGKVSRSSRSVCGDTPRKRGRPRKLST